MAVNHWDHRQRHCKGVALPMPHRDEHVVGRVAKHRAPVYDQACHELNAAQYGKEDKVPPYVGLDHAEERVRVRHGVLAARRKMMTAQSGRRGKKPACACNIYRSSARVWK